MGLLRKVYSLWRQVTENFHGAPKKMIGRIENQKDLNDWVKVIKGNIKNYTPPPTALKKLSPNEKIKTR